MGIQTSTKFRVELFHKHPYFQRKKIYFRSFLRYFFQEVTLPHVEPICKPAATVNEERRRTPADSEASDAYARCVTRTLFTLFRERPCGGRVAAPRHPTTALLRILRQHFYIFFLEDIYRVVKLC